MANVAGAGRLYDNRWQHEPRAGQAASGARRSVLVGLCLAVVIGLACTPAILAAIDVQPADGKLRVMLDGELFAEYRDAGYAKPIVYPLVGPGGVRMTRDYPMVPNVVGEPHDHEHHQSMWFTHGDVNGVDFWTQGAECGRVVQVGDARVIKSGDAVCIATDNQWVDALGKEICRDHRQVTFWTSSATGSSRFVDWEVTLKASAGDVKFGDTKEGTMGIRLRPELQLDPDPAAGVTNVHGRAINSEGVTGNNVWGKRARWIDYSGEVDGRLMGIAILDHPANPRHPTWWHARGYGLVAANPFGVQHFEQKPPGQGDMLIPAEQSRTFRYRFVLHEGSAQDAKIAELYDVYGNSGRPRVLGPGERPQDRRLQPPKDLNGYFPFEPPTTREAWEARAATVRQQLLVALGLWPMPERGPIRATVHGRVDQDGYSIEKVYFESYPGHFVTGNLYRPRPPRGEVRDVAGTGKFPMILCPHGHWENGRYHDMGRRAVRAQIVVGAERFEEGGRRPIQALCVQLARMGCMVFNYDMVGYGDSQQIPFRVAHRHHAARPEMETTEDWGFYSTQAELRLQTIMGLQTYNSLCALDWACSLPEVDANRIGVTGGSGGGTQTMILGAIDPRPAVLFPAVMVSTAMQGGCMCENASLLRVGTGNVEFAALAAPRPLGMTTANDWTRDLATKGFPELKQLYTLLGVPENVFVATLNHFPHNYNYVSRAVMFRWMNQHLKLGWEEPIVEEDFAAHSPEDLRVWNEEHPAPPGGAEHERSLLRAMTAIAQRQLDAVKPRDRQSLQEFRDLVGGAWQVIIGRQPPSPSEIQCRGIRKTDRGSYWQVDELVRDDRHGEELPMVMLVPKQAARDVVIWLDGAGKRALFAPDNQPIGPIRELLAAGAVVVTADLMGQGEFLLDGRPETELREASSKGDYAGYTLGYNASRFSRRVHDILSLVAAVAERDPKPQRLHLVGTGGAGPWAAAARAALASAVDTLAIDTGGFRFGDLKTWRDLQFVPGAVKYGDLPGLLALSAPNPIWLAGERGTVPPLAAAAYQAADAPKSIVSSACLPAEVPAQIVQWLSRMFDGQYQPTAQARGFHPSQYQPAAQARASHQGFHSLALRAGI